MKTFFQFFTESLAVQQATRMGLKSDGHGGWYDKKGEFVAKTERGQLKFFNKRQKIGKQDPPQSEKEKKSFIHKLTSFNHQQPFSWCPYRFILFSTVWLLSLSSVFIDCNYQIITVSLTFLQHQYVTWMHDIKITTCKSYYLSQNNSS